MSEHGLSEEDREYFRARGAREADWTPEQLRSLDRIAGSTSHAAGKSWEESVRFWGSEERAREIQEHAQAVADAMPPWTEEQLVELARFAEEGRARTTVPSSPSSRIQTDHTALYRHFDEDGVLLYVGITNKPDTRRRAHQKRAVWAEFADQTREEVKWYSTRQAALEAETEAIETEKPLFNRLGATGRYEETVRYLTRQDRLDLLRVNWET